MNDNMAFGFTSVSSLLKDEAKLAQDAGAEAYGVAVINDLDGKHEPIRSSNAQMHLFMQIKKGNVDSIYFQSPEQADILIENIRSYFGQEKADGYLSGLSLDGNEETVQHLSSIGFGRGSSIPALADKIGKKS